MTLLSMVLSANAQQNIKAQKIYELSAPAQPKVIKSGHLRMGGVNPKGERIDVNSFYMSIGGKPVIPVMGEFHYSRYPAEQWEEEILKMKAGGVTVLPTYVFWSLHEEVEGQFRWDGQRNLRGFNSHGDRHLGMGACFHGHFFAIFLMVS